MTLALTYFGIVHVVAPKNILNNLNYAYALRLDNKFEKAQLVLTESYYGMGQYDQYFNVIHDMYFKLLMDQEKYQEIIKIASNQVNKTYAKQYLFKALSHFKMSNIVDFELISGQYFEYYKGQSPTIELTDWANLQVDQLSGLQSKRSTKSTKL